MSLLKFWIYQIAIAVIFAVYGSVYGDPYVSTYLGQCGTTGTSSSPARFNRPASLKFDSETNSILVADKTNNCIRQIDLALGTVSTIVGTCGSANGNVDAVGTMSDARFSGPTGMSELSNGGSDYNDAFFMADSGNNCVKHVTISAGMTGPYLGTCGAVGGYSVSLMNAPYDVWSLSSSGFYYSDSGNHCLRSYDDNDGSHVTLAGACTQSGYVDGQTTLAKFNTPRGFKFGNAGTFIVDSGNHCIRLLGATVSTFAGACTQSGYVDGTGTNAKFNSPRDLAIDSNDNFFVTDSGGNCIRKVTSAGVVTTIAGQCGTAAASVDGSGTSAKFSAPWGIALDNDNNLYVSEESASCIRKLSPCAPNSVIVSGTCNCNAGYFSSGSSCTICSDGYFKRAVGNGACSSCAIGTESFANKTGCSTCPSGKYRSTTAQTACVNCPTNASCNSTSFTCSIGYEVNSNNDGCQACGLNFYRSNPSQPACLACPTYATCTTTGFTCNNGYQLSGSQCVAVQITNTPVATSNSSGNTAISTTSSTGASTTTNAANLDMATTSWVSGNPIATSTAFVVNALTTSISVGGNIASSSIGAIANGATTSATGVANVMTTSSVSSSSVSSNNTSSSTSTSSINTANSTDFLQFILEYVASNMIVVGAAGIVALTIIIITLIYCCRGSKMRKEPDFSYQTFNATTTGKSFIMDSTTRKRTGDTTIV